MLETLANDASASESLQAAAERAQRSTVKVRINHQAGGSGIVWDNHVIITNAHVAMRSPIEIVTFEGVSLAGEVIARRAQDDLAAIRVQADSMPTARVGNSSTVRPGHVVFSLGNPQGMTTSLAVGVVHAIGRPAPGRRHALIQADIRLAPGYSGGPMLDAAGTVIGVNTMISGGLGLAIPSNMVTDFLATASRPRLGVTLQPVTFPHERQAAAAGLLVTSLLPESPAERGGLYVGDIIVGINNQAVGHPEELAEALRQTSSARIEVVRGNGIVTGEVELTGWQPSSVKRAA
jgi:serine protease Do